MVTRRRYTKADKARAVALATIGTVEAAAEKSGIPRTTIIYWLDKPEFVELRQKTRDLVAESMWTAIQIGVDEVAKGLVSDAPLRDKSIALGVLYDKYALMTGGATGRTENRELNDLPDSAYVDAIHEWRRLTGPSGERPDPAPAEEPAG